MEPGTPIRCEMTKWGDRPHWQFPGIHLGADEHGDWLGFPQGTLNTRPGLELVSQAACVTLVPTDGWYAATFHAPGIWCDLYVDIATPGRWDGTVLRAVDLDLDVIRMSDPLPASVYAEAEKAGRVAGEVFVDDEDEFAEHQVAYGYPTDVIDRAQASCDAVLADVRAGRAPYDGTHRRWLDELSRLTASA
jgi:predicted RNA-binding protein associated with RNAse of E/G family